MPCLSQQLLTRLLSWAKKSLDKKNEVTNLAFTSTHPSLPHLALEFLVAKLKEVRVESLRAEELQLRGAERGFLHTPKLCLSNKQTLLDIL